MGGLRVSDLFLGPATHPRLPREVSEAEKQIAYLRRWLNERERAPPVTIVYCDLQNFDAGIARALALAVQGELVEVVPTPSTTIGPASSE